MNQFLTTVKSNVDTKTVTSVVVGMAVFGGVVYLAKKSGVKPLKDAVKVAQGGK